MPGTFKENNIFPILIKGSLIWGGYCVNSYWSVDESTIYRASSPDKIRAVVCACFFALQNVSSDTCDLNMVVLACHSFRRPQREEVVGFTDLVRSFFYRALLRFAFTEEQSFPPRLYILAELCCDQTSSGKTALSREHQNTPVWTFKRRRGPYTNTHLRCF